MSTGVYGAYHPCVRDLPAMTGGLKVSAALNGDGLSITVDSPNREFDRVEWRHPTIYLMFEHAGNNEDARATENEQAADRKSSPSDFPKLPVKLRLKLPPKWREATEMTGACRVSVIVASRVPPQRPGGVKIVESRAEKTVGATRVTTKSGEWVLRTDWLALPDIYK